LHTIFGKILGSVQDMMLHYQITSPTNNLTGLTSQSNLGFLGELLRNISYQLSASNKKP
jgi:hypothetical protein